jgi:hypothetical protein
MEKRRLHHRFQEVQQGSTLPVRSKIELAVGTGQALRYWQTVGNSHLLQHKKLHQTAETMLQKTNFTPPARTKSKGSCHDFPKGVELALQGRNFLLITQQTMSRYAANKGVRLAPNHPHATVATSHVARHKHPLGRLGKQGN